MKSKMFRPISQESNYSELFYVEHKSNELRPPRPNTPIVLNSTEMSGNNTQELRTISSLALHHLGPKLLKFTLIWMNQRCHIDLDGGYRIFRQTRTIWTCCQSIQYTGNTGSSKPSSRRVWWKLQPTTTGAFGTVTDIDAPLNLSTIDRWETSDTTTNDNKFYSDDEPRRFFFYPQVLPHRRHPEGWKENWVLECPPQKEVGMSQHICDACGQSLPEPKDIPGSSSTN